jgi:hypothetical protein
MRFFDVVSLSRQRGIPMAIEDGGGVASSDRDAAVYCHNLRYTLLNFFSVSGPAIGIIACHSSAQGNVAFFFRFAFFSLCR